MFALTYEITVSFALIMHMGLNLSTDQKEIQISSELLARIMKYYLYGAKCSKFMLLSKESRVKTILITQTMWFKIVTLCLYHNAYYGRFQYLLTITYNTFSICCGRDTGLSYSNQRCSRFYELFPQGKKV